MEVILCFVVKLPEFNFFFLKLSAMGIDQHIPIPSETVMAFDSNEIKVVSEPVLAGLYHAYRRVA